MNQRQINLITMSEEIAINLDKYYAIWQQYSVISKQIQKLKAINNLVQNNISKQINSGIEAYSKQKNLILTELVHKVYKIALKAKGYAKINNNKLLLEEVDIQVDKILEESDETVIHTCENILNHVALIQEHLIEDFNLSEDLIINASANLMQVKQMVSIKDNLNKTDALLSEHLRSIVAELKKVIDVLDDLIYGIIENDQLINNYKEIRKKTNLA
jgi:hypothetical protein